MYDHRGILFNNYDGVVMPEKGRGWWWWWWWWWYKRGRKSYSGGGGDGDDELKSE